MHRMSLHSQYYVLMINTHATYISKSIYEITLGLSIFLGTSSSSKWTLLGTLWCLQPGNPCNYVVHVP